LERTRIARREGRIEMQGESAADVVLRGIEGRQRHVREAAVRDVELERIDRGTARPAGDGVDGRADLYFLDRGPRIRTGIGLRSAATEVGGAPRRDARVIEPVHDLEGLEQRRYLRVGEEPCPAGGG